MQFAVRLQNINYFDQIIFATKKFSMFKDVKIHSEVISYFKNNKLNNLRLPMISDISIKCTCSV